MTRNQNINRNLVFNTIKTVASIILGFASRTILIYYLGAEYLGLNGLFSNIFSVLNLVELGIGTAIVFSMYKPIVENDIEKIKALQNLYKKYYFIIMLVVVGLGLILLPFLSYLIKDGVSADINIYVLYLMYLFNTVLSYFSAHKRSLLFAYQRNDIENKVVTIVTFASTITQIVVLVLTRNYYIYYAINMLAALANCILIHIIANKMFPQINGPSKPLDLADKKEISKNVAALSVHKIGSAVVMSTDNIIISAFLGAVILGVYSNYFMIITYIISFFAILSNAITGSVGNLIASSNIDYTYTKYKQINFIFVYLTAFCTICLLCLFQPFIKVWTGGGQYLMNYSTVILLCASFYISRIITAESIFKECAGIFRQDKWRPLIEAIINLAVSIVLVLFIGIDGVIIGTIVSSLLCPFWVGPHMVYKHYFKRKTIEYFKDFAIDFIKFIIALLPCLIVCKLIPDGGIGLFLAKVAACVVLSNVLLILLYLPTKEFKACVGMIKPIFNKVFRKNHIINADQVAVVEPVVQQTDESIFVTETNVESKDELSIEVKDNPKSEP